jgi:hypothetical protein
MVVCREKLAPGTLVVCLTGGAHEGCVGRLHAQVPKQVCVSVVADQRGNVPRRELPGSSQCPDSMPFCHSNVVDPSKG